MFSGITQCVFILPEVIVAVWCSLRFLSEMIIFLSWLMQNPVILTPKQYQLLAVNPRGTKNNFGICEAPCIKTVPFSTKI